MLLAAEGRLGTFVVGKIYCSLISACDQLGELQRAAEWTEVGGQWAVPWLAPHSAATITRGEWPTTAGRGIDGDDLVIVAMDDPGRVSGISA